MKYTLSVSALLACQPCTSTDQTRMALNGVYLDAAGYYVATDGHVMIVHKANNLGDGESLPGLTVMLSKEAISLLRKSSFPSCFWDSENGILETAGTRQGKAGAVKFDGQFPNWREVLPSGDRRKALDVLTMNVTLLSKFPGGKYGLTIFPTGTEGVMMVQPSHGEWVGAIMPMRTAADAPNALYAEAKASKEPVKQGTRQGYRGGSPCLTHG